MNFSEIKVIAFDIDGTLTDGTIYIGPEGEALKVFHVKDGYGIKAAQKAGLEVFFITGRPAHAPTLARMKDLNIDLKYLKHSVPDKVVCAKQIMDELGCELHNLAFMGDDIPDLELLEQVGFSGAPKDAHPKVLGKVKFVSQHNGGQGAAREFIDKILGV